MFSWYTRNNIAFTKRVISQTNATRLVYNLFYDKPDIRRILLISCKPPPCPIDHYVQSKKNLILQEKKISRAFKYICFLSEDLLILIRAPVFIYVSLSFLKRVILKSFNRSIKLYVQYRRFIAIFAVSVC